MDWIRDNISVMTLIQILNWVRDNASLIIIFLLLCCIFYLKRTSRHLAHIGKIMRDVKWISSKETRQD
jgi:hypothetical protein